MKLKTVIQSTEITLFWKNKKIRTIKYHDENTAEFEIIKECENAIFNKMYDTFKERGENQIKTGEVKNHLLSYNQFYYDLVKWLEKEK